MSASPQPTSPRDNVVVRLVLRAGSQVWATLALPLLAIVLALIAGAVVIILTSALEPGKPMDFGLPLRAYGALLEGSLGSENGRTSTLVQAAPLILAGLGIGLGELGRLGCRLVGCVEDRDLGIDGLGALREQRGALQGLQLRAACSGAHVDLALDGRRAQVDYG